MEVRSNSRTTAPSIPSPFRRHFAVIMAGDPVHREMIPCRAPTFDLRGRLKLELYAALRKAGVCMSGVVFVLSEKNRKEVRAPDSRKPGSASPDYTRLEIIVGLLP